MGNFGVNFDDPFEAQAKALRERLKNQVPTEKWDDMLGEAHTKVFTVAGAMKADLLADLADAVGKSKGLKQFQEDFKGIVEKHGWDYNGDFDWRTRTIYMTNLRTSYAAGRLEQLQDYPLWMYKHSDLVTNPRQQHKAWSGLTLAADDPWWRSHYPPNGWGCQCRIIGVRGPKDVARYKGYIGEAPPIKIDPKTGAPLGIDRGWDYMPGSKTAEHLKGLTPELVDDLPKGKPVMDGPVCKLGTIRLSTGDCPGPIPEPRPFDEKKLLKPDLTEIQYVEGFLKEFGASIASPKVFKDVTGERLIISDELFINRKKTAKAGKKVYKVLKRERNIYLPLLAQTIIDPQEIWMVPEEIKSQGNKLVYRRRYLAWWTLPGRNTPGLAVFESVDRKEWTGITTFVPEKDTQEDLEKYMQSIRSVGILEFKK